MNPPIKLEDDFEPSWEDAQNKLKNAEAAFGFPFLIIMDETAEAYKDAESYGADREMSRLVAYEFADMYGKVVKDMDEAKRALYPWFHDGETMG